MKKLAINITLKQVLTSPIWLLRAWRLRSKARKYQKTPELLPIEDRYSYILKLSKKILKMYNIDLVVEGYDNLPANGGVILAPNHKSNIDPIVLIAALQKQSEEAGAMHKYPTFIAKDELNKKLMVGNALKLLDCATIDRKNFRESIQKLFNFTKEIKANKTYGVIFPEGTRVKGDELGEFKGGAFTAAQKNLNNIVPVCIKNSEFALDKTKRKGRLTITVKFLPVLKANNFLAQDSKSIGEHVRNLIAKEMR
ncbi:lysophospholipid acyltransferase family protein [Mycoplasma corogypsi]|uniref:lysophospholipid acyltransferase family protein n=1 Tax=Mycoplasma corogypsi TaxID=2106 RepID=UPI003872D866